MKETRVLIEHALDCIGRIQNYTSGGKSAFMSSGLIQDAVVRNLQVMCESVSRIPESVRTVNDEIEWRGISGLRNILVHDYLGVDVELVWQVIENRLPELAKSLEKLISSI